MLSDGEASRQQHNETLCRAQSDSGGMKHPIQRNSTKRSMASALAGSLLRARTDTIQGGDTMRTFVMRWGLWCVIVAVTVWVASSMLSSPPAVNAQTDTWTYTGDDDDEAAKSLANFLKEHGMSASYVQGGLVRLKVDDVNLALDPRPTKDDIDRICIHIGFNVKPQSKRAVGKLLEKVNELNRRYNTGGFYLDEDKDLAFQTQITLLDTISYREIELAVRWAVRSVVFQIMRHMEDDLM